MGFFKKIKNSIYNFEAYKLFFKESVGKAILYLFLFCLCIYTISDIFLAFSINSVANEITNTVENEVPDFNLSNGKLTVDGEMPIKFKDKDMYIIIDTENNVDSSVLDNYSQGMILTKDKYVQKQVTGQILSYKWTDFGNIDFNNSDVPNIVSIIKTIAIILVIIFVPFIQFLIKLAFGSFVVMAIGGVIISAILNKNLKYSECAKLGMYSLTVPIILENIKNILDFNIAYFWIIYYGVAFLYLFLAIKRIDTQPQINQSYNTLK